MTDRELLLKDLSQRVLYGTKLMIDDEQIVDLVGICEGHVIVRNGDGLIVLETVDGVKPILRSPLDMTDEELATSMSLYDMRNGDGKVYITVSKFMELFLNGHFDYNGLIEKGLAHETKLGEIYKK